MHEQSETIERDGRYWNVSGVTGETLEGPFPDLDTAVQSAKARSASFDGDPSLADPRVADADVPEPQEAAVQPPQEAAVRPPSSFFPTQPNLPAPKEFRLDDLTTAPPEYWDDLHTGYENGTVSSDDLYEQLRQRQHDQESPMLAMQREEDQQQRIAAAEAAPKPPDEREPGAGPEPLGQRGFGQFGYRPDAALARRDAEGNVEVTMGISQQAPPRDERLQPQGTPQPGPVAQALGTVGVTHEDIDIVRGLVRGPRKAVDATGSLAAGLAEQLTGLDLSHIRQASVAESVLPGEPDTTLGGFAQTTAQYLTYAAPVGMAIKGALAAGEAATAAGAGEAVAVQTVGRKLFHWAMTAEGADIVADFFAFDANDPRMSNLIHEMFPGLENEVTRYLAATGQDTELEGRLKNVIEGRLMSLGLAGAGEAAMLTLKGLKLGRELVRETVKSMPQIDLGFVVDKTGQISRFVIPTQPEVMRNEVGGVRMPPKPPSLDKDVTYAEMGRGSSSWYHGVGNYVKGKLGAKDGNLFLDMMAIASQGQLAGVADLNIAIDAFNRLRRGEKPEQIVQDLRIGNVTGPNIRQHLLKRMTGTPLNDIFGVSELKMRDYRRALDGDPKVVVVDRWMWRT